MKQIKQFLLSLAFVFLFTICFSQNVLAADTYITTGNCGKNGSNLKWTIINTTLIISGTGEMQDYPEFGKSPWHAYRIDNLIIEPGITRIGNYAFYNFGGYGDSIESINLPNTITSLGEYSLYNLKCETITIPGSIKKLDAEGCLPTEAKRVVFQKGTTKITTGIFDYDEQTTVEHITFPEGLTSIDIDMCADMVSLKSVILPNSLTRIEDGAFSRTGLDSIKIPKNVTYLGCDALSDISNIFIYSTSDNLNLYNDKDADPPFEDDSDITVFGYKNVKKILLAEGYEKINFIDLCSISEHDIQKVDAVSPTEKQNGNKLHYKCTQCDARFSDAAGKTKITDYSWVIPAKKINKKLKVQVITYKNVATYKASKLKKKKTSFQLGAKTNGNGKLTYKVIKYPKKAKKYISVNKKGTVTLKKGCKKGTYKIRISASKTSTYNPTEVIVTINVKK